MSSEPILMVPSSTKILKTRWYLFFFGTVGTTAYQVCAKKAVPLELKWGAYSYKCSIFRC